MFFSSNLQIATTPSHADLSRRDPEDSYILQKDKHRYLCDKFLKKYGSFAQDMQQTK